MRWALCKKRRRAAEVGRGGALLGGRCTKRAWNLRFQSTPELSDTHTLCMFMCQYGFIRVVVYIFVFWFVHICVQERECAWTPECT